MTYDVFICHATEDEDEFVRPLAEALCQAGLRVWYAEFSLKLGDSLRQSIEKGLASSRYGVVVLSPSFFEKHWAQQEMNGLTQKEVDGTNVILPVWHRVDREYVLRFSPMLADRVAAQSGDGVAAVVQRIMDVVMPRSDAETVDRQPEVTALGRAILGVLPSGEYWAPASAIWRQLASVWGVSLEAVRAELFGLPGVAVRTREEDSEIVYQRR